MWLCIGHSTVWCMVMNISEEQSGSIFTDHQKTEAVCPGQILHSHQSDYTVP